MRFFFSWFALTFHHVSLFEWKNAAHRPTTSILSNGILRSWVRLCMYMCLVHIFLLPLVPPLNSHTTHVWMLGLLLRLIFLVRAVLFTFFLYLRSCSRLSENWKGWSENDGWRKKKIAFLSWIARAMRSVRFLFLFHLLRTIYINSGSNENDQKRNLKYKTYRRRRWQANLFIHFENPFSIRTVFSFFFFLLPSFLRVWHHTHTVERWFFWLSSERVFFSHFVLSPSISTLPFRIKNIKIYTFITHTHMYVQRTRRRTTACRHPRAV